LGAFPTKAVKKPKKRMIPGPVRKNSNGGNGYKQTGVEELTRRGS